MSPAVFAHGHLRLYLLSLLAERSMHGYELIQALSDRFGGTYVPSAGTIYPRLAKLEEEGLVTKEADGRNLVTVDATCPLVKRVHSSVKRHSKNDLQVVLIGHRGHPEVVGTMGQLDAGSVILVEKPEDVWSLQGVNEEGLAYTTQTTLSIEETRDIIAALKARFPKIKGPEKGDLCYATTNRQQAVTEMAGLVDMLIVIGSANSSNSNRLRELGARMGKPSYLIDGPGDVKREWFQGVSNVGISSGASAPEDLVQDVVKWIQAEFPGTAAEDFTILEENVHFSLPDILTAAR